MFTFFQSECLRHALSNIQRTDGDKSVLSDPLIALGRDSHARPPDSGSSSSQHQTLAHKLRVLQTLVDAQKSALKRLTECLREAEAQKTCLMRDLDAQAEKHQREMAIAAQETVAAAVAAANKVTKENTTVQGTGPGTAESADKSSESVKKVGIFLDSS